MIGAMRSRRSALAAGILALLAAPELCPAHCDSPTTPTPPTPPRRTARGQIVWAAPQRWSWLHWWEANRDPHLQTLRQGRSFQKPDPRAVAAARKQAVDALIEALDSKHRPLRASAALALGRMEEHAACHKLIALAKSDGELTVRRVALVALGLLDSDEARRFLLGHTFTGEDEREAALVGIGLSDKGGPDVLEGLQATLATAGAGRASLAARGLRRRGDPNTVKLLGRLVRKSTSPWLVSEGIGALGCQGKTTCIQPLADVLLATPQGRSFAVHRALTAAHEERMKAAAGAPAAAEAFALWLRSPLRRKPKPLQRSRTGDPMVGFEPIYQARLRASAAIALGEIDHPASRRVLRQALAGEGGALADLYKGMAIVSLGRLGDPRAAPDLLAILSLHDVNGIRKTDGELSSPLRGCAALALGLYARPVPSPQGPADRLGYDKLCRALAERMADRTETLEVRAAAAMGLGLTRRTENLRYLQRAAGTVAAGEDLLIGYMLLARGMLGDGNILAPAAKYLAVANDRTDMSGILGRRAAVLGLGLLGKPQALPILRTSWDLNYYVTREVALAYALIGTHNPTGELVLLMQTHARPLARAFAARCLGELFAARRPQRLALLINGGNYMVRNDRMAPYGALANEFLYTYLLAAFGDDWR